MNDIENELLKLVQLDKDIGNNGNKKIRIIQFSMEKL
jgi:hypothetical protein